MRKIALIIIISMIALACFGCADECYCPPSVYTQNFYETLFPDNWLIDEHDLEGHWFCELKFPEINNDVLASGAVLVYYLDEYKNWVLLPYTTEYVNTAGIPYHVELWSGYRLGYLDIDYINFNNTNPPTKLELKITIIRY